MCQGVLINSKIHLISTSSLWCRYLNTPGTHLPTRYWEVGSIHIREKKEVTEYFFFFFWFSYSYRSVLISFMTWAFFKDCFQIYSILNIFFFTWTLHFTLLMPSKCCRHSCHHGFLYEAQCISKSNGRISFLWIASQFRAPTIKTSKLTPCQE